MNLEIAKNVEIANFEIDATKSHIATMRITIGSETRELWGRELDQRNDATRWHVMRGIATRYPTDSKTHNCGLFVYVTANGITATTDCAPTKAGKMPTVVGFYDHPANGARSKYCH